MITSIVINTLNRAASLDITLESLTRIVTRPGTSFEVIVVNGPSTDDTESVLKKWTDSIRIEKCPLPNLSISRNIGIKSALGEVIAFLDDDSLPEANWLIELETAYKDPAVGAAGGPVFDFNGFDYQVEYELIDRFGNPKKTRGPTPFFSYPESPYIPHLLGANSSFRASAIRQIGGFDETYEYFLDESDVLLRLQDAGFLIRQLPCAFVHHKSRQSGIRNSQRVPTDRFSIIKNKIYFINKHAGHAPSALVENQIDSFLKKHEAEVVWATGEGLLTTEQAEDFRERQLPTAIQTAAELKGKNPRTLVEEDLIPTSDRNFKAFPTRDFSENTERIILISRGLPPQNQGGISRFVWTLAQALSKGAHVHVITESTSDVEYIDFSDGVWIHYLSNHSSGSNHYITPIDLPKNLSDWSSVAMTESLRIMSRMRVDVIEAPIWDAEGIAFVSNKDLFANVKIVTSLHTTLKHYIESNAALRSDERWMTQHFHPVTKAEQRQLAHSDGIRANSNAIVEDIQQKYNLRFRRGSLEVIPHGLPKRTMGANKGRQVSGKENKTINVLFVGRLEPRKGIETLLHATELLFDQCLPKTESKARDVSVIICGKDNTSISINEGKSYKSDFLFRNEKKEWIESVTFTGELNEAELWEQYSKCDIFVAPSRFESFGLIYLEAMSLGKPVIGTLVGGVPEVVQNGVNGILVPSDEPQQLADAILRLIADKGLRRSYGQASLKIFEERFTDEKMAAQSIGFYQRLFCNKSVKVVVAHSILAKRDGISNIIIEHITYIRGLENVEVSFLGYRCDYDDIDSRVIRGREDFLKSPEVIGADIIIFHHGIYYDFFDTLSELSAHKACYVIFHNITPPELVPESGRELVSKSFDQVRKYRFATKVFSISSENLRVLGQFSFDNIDPDPIGPYCDVDRLKGTFLKHLQQRRDSTRAPRTIISFIGRMVPPKGSLDMLEALKLLVENNHLDVVKSEINLLSNIDFGDSAYREQVVEYLKHLKNDFGLVVNFFEGIDDESRDRVLLRTDVFVLPSYHEGYGLPFLEALSFGCRVVAYKNSNSKILLDGVGYLAPTGDISQLSVAIARAIEDVNKAASQSDSYAYYDKCEDFLLREIDQWNNNFLCDRILPITNQSLEEPSGHVSWPSELRLVTSSYGFEHLRLYNKLIYTHRRLRSGGLLPGTNLWREELVKVMSNKLLPKFSKVIFSDQMRSQRRNGWIINPAEDARVIASKTGDNWVDILWGPYIDLAPGSYSLRFDMRNAHMRQAKVLLQATANAGGELIASNIVAVDLKDGEEKSDLFTLDFSLANQRDNVELRLTLVDGALICDEIVRSVVVSP